MKKLITVLLAAVLLLALAAGCTGVSDISAGDIANKITGYVIDKIDETVNAGSEGGETEEQPDAQPEQTGDDQQTGEPEAAEELPDEDGRYYSAEDVALYIHVYGKLPANYITKKQAEDLGWTGGSIEKYAPGCCLGGSYFGNYEGKLPSESGRKWTECDIDTAGKSSRGAKRIVFSNDGLIYYTDDHYESLTLLYTAEGKA